MFRTSFCSSTGRPYCTCTIIWYVVHDEITIKCSKNSDQRPKPTIFYAFIDILGTQHSYLDTFYRLLMEFRHCKHTIKLHVEYSLPDYEHKIFKTCRRAELKH
jgi:hypothetical protein